MREVLALFVVVLLARPCLGQVDISNDSSAAVFMDPVVRSNLKYLYSSQAKEIPLCLHGEFIGKDTVLISRVSFPRIVASEDRETRFWTGRCLQGDYVGLVHNHNVRAGLACIPSEKDIKGFHRDFLASVAVIACSWPTDRVWFQGRYKW